MSEEFPSSAGGAPAQDESSEGGTPPVLNLTVPGLVLVIQLAATAFLMRASTLYANAAGLFGAPLIGLIVISIWWLRAKAVPRTDRWIGLALFAALVAGCVFAQQARRQGIVVLAVPALMAAAVVALVLTSRTSWPVRRWIVVGAMVVCAGALSLSRIDDIRGNLMPVLAWRWAPVEGDLMADANIRSENPGGRAKIPEQVNSKDWAEFRGPKRNGRLAGVTFATDWNQNPPKELWRRPVGLGFSSFAAIGDYVFTQEQRGRYEVVVCYHGTTGEEVWINRVEERFSESMGDGPRATPTIDLGKLYVLGATGILQCLDAATGETIWHRNIQRDNDASIPVWGFASSPLIRGDLVIVFAGGRGGQGVAAYNRQTGEKVWSKGDGTHSYASIQEAEIGGVKQLLAPSDIGIQAHAIDTGEILWEHRWEIKTNPRCVQPTVPGGDVVLLGTAGGLGTRRLEIGHRDGGWRVEEQWTAQRLRPYFNDVVYHERNLYGYDGQRLVSFNAVTGERNWAAGNYGGQVLMIVDMDVLLVLSEDGEVSLLRATPERAEVIAKFKALEGKTWNHPVIAHGKLYVRNSREAACFELNPAP